MTAADSTRDSTLADRLALLRIGHKFEQVPAQRADGRRRIERRQADDIPAAFGAAELVGFAIRADGD